MQRLIYELRQELGEGLGAEERHGNEFRLEVRRDLFPAACRHLSHQGRAALVNMVGTDEREIDGCYRLYYTFSPEDADLFITLISGIPPEDPAFPSVTPVVPAAHWYEREVQDLLGLAAQGHPDPRPLVLHRQWPRSLYPLRKDFDGTVQPELTGEHFPFRQVEGDGVCQVPVGPIHAGIIEPGHFRFSVVGEAIINLEAQLFYTHRGVEKRCEGMPYHRALLLAERTCGACSFSHSTAFCQAVEKLAGVVVPERAGYLRAMLLELERLYNHIGDIGNICAGVGLAFGTSHGGRLKERLMALNQRVAGNRFLRGVNVTGGVGRDLDDDTRRVVLDTVAEVRRDFREVLDILLDNSAFRDRLETTGVLSTQVARDLGVVGPAARASGIDRDTRRDHPHAAYDRLSVRVPVYTQGDVMARFRVRADEVIISLDMVEELLNTLPAGPVRIGVGSIPPYRAALGYTESPRGEDIHWVMSGPGDTVFRCRIRSASYCNWPAVPMTVPGNIVPDFPLINKSFELCYSCTDR
ncbi:hypothetical protein SY88_13045 [Clostridiales bacterium PH28_bin88]|nr:hypothetical protein SY88_13045 [Clostridiales bacterium PH28_bin88]